jgi:hypothetical protein
MSLSPRRLTRPRTLWNKDDSPQSDRLAAGEITAGLEESGQRQPQVAHLLRQYAADFMREYRSQAAALVALQRRSVGQSESGRVTVWGSSQPARRSRARGSVIPCFVLRF